MKSKNEENLSNFEKGFSQYIKMIEVIKNAKGHVTPAMTRKLNDAIRLMASEDFECMKGIVVNKWMINRALKGWAPSETNPNAWVKVSENIRSKASTARESNDYLEKNFIPGDRIGLAAEQ